MGRARAIIGAAFVAAGCTPEPSHVEPVASARQGVEISPPFKFDEGLNQGLTAPGHRLNGRVDIAFGGSEFFAVWSHERDWASRIFSTRIEPATGSVVDPYGISVVDGGFYYESVEPTVAFDGTQYLVVFAASELSDWNIVGVRVLDNGTVLDDPPLAICSAAGNQRLPAVAFGGGTFYVVWQDERDGTSDIYGTPVAADGAVGIANGAAIAQAAGAQEEPAVTFGGGNFLVAWDDRRAGDADIFARRITGAGALLDPELTVNAALNDQTRPSLDHDGNNTFLLAWQDEELVAEDDINALRLDNDGAALGSEFGIGVAAPGQGSPDVVFDGTDFVVSWQKVTFPAIEEPHRDVEAARVQTDGTIIDDPAISISSQLGHEANPAAAVGAGTTVLVWDDNRIMVQQPALSIYRQDPYAARLVGGIVQEPEGVPLSSSANAQARVDVAFNGTHYLAVWLDSRNATVDLYASRFDKSGAALDGPGIPVTTPAGGALILGTVSSNGDSFLVTWMRGTDVYATLVGAEGTVATVNGQLLFGSGGNNFVEAEPRSASNGTDYLIAWSQGGDGTFDDTIAAARMTGDGVVVESTPTVLGQSSSGVTNPRVQYGADRYLVAWGDGRNDAGDIYGTLIGTDGNIIAADFPICSFQDVQTQPWVGFDGTDFYVVWADGRLAGQNNDTFGTRLSPDGDVADIDGVPLFTEANAPSGINFFQTGYAALFQTNEQLSMGRFRPDGSVIDAAAFPLANGGLDPHARLASGQDGTFAAMWYDFVEGAPYSAFRLTGRVAGWSPLATECSGDEECFSGWCVDGVCCDDACGGSDPTDCRTCGGDGACTVTDTPGSCDDANPCTVNTCDVVGACYHPNQLDGVECPGGVCVAGSCVPDPQATQPGDGGGPSVTAGAGGANADPSGTAPSHRPLPRLEGGGLCGFAPPTGSAFGWRYWPLLLLVAACRRRRTHTSQRMRSS